MGVQENGRLAGRRGTGGDHGRKPTIDLDDPCVQTFGFEQFCHRGGRSPYLVVAGRVGADGLDAHESLEIGSHTREHVGDRAAEIAGHHIRLVPSIGRSPSDYRVRVQVWSQRRQWSAFVLVVGLVLLGLNGLDASLTAFVLGVVMVLAGLLGLLIR
jgi:hypothetical protein